MEALLRFGDGCLSMQAIIDSTAHLPFIAKNTGQILHTMYKLAHDCFDKSMLVPQSFAPSSRFVLASSTISRASILEKLLADYSTFKKDRSAESLCCFLAELIHLRCDYFCKPLVYYYRGSKIATLFDAVSSGGHIVGVGDISISS